MPVEKEVVLSIDDEKHIRDSIRNYLEDHDYHVLTAANGRAGVEIFEREAPGLVLVDLRMPGMDGLEVLAHIRERSPDTPIIIISGTGVMGDAVEALRLGAWDYILKPIEDLTVLLHSVERALERVRLIKENRAYQGHLEEEVAKRTRELEQASEALRQSEENLSITLDSIGDAVIATDAEGRVSRMNPVAEQLTGWPLEEAQNLQLSRIFRIIEAGTRMPIQSPVEKVMNSGRITQLKSYTVLIARDGTERRIADSGAPIRNRDGNIVGVVLVFRDVTEQHKLEEQLRQSSKMDAIGKLAGGVAHDFNNMLGGILGAADLLAIKIRDDEDLLKYLHIIQDAGNRAADLTQKLLSFARKSPEIAIPGDIHDIVKAAARILEHSTDKRIKIRLHLNAEFSLVRGDPSQIENALLNLGINAGDAMPEGGILTISSRNVTFDRQFGSGTGAVIGPGTYIEVSVSDTGTGMGKDLLEHIFEPFFTTKGAGKGTGLGLSSVYTMIRNHNGDIRVYSEFGRGTVFKLYLAVDRSPIPSAALDEEEKIIYGSGCILVADDEAVIRGMAEGILSDLGYDVILAKDGKAAVDIFREEHQRIDLVILDLVMPNMNGRDAFFAMRSLHPGVKVLLTSGFSREVEKIDVSEPGIVGFIQKPFGRAELSQYVDKAMKNRQRYQPREESNEQRSY
jgi:PAS domain S-box-containing protein